MSKDIIKMHCPNCDLRLKVPSTKLGKSIVCPKCSVKFKYNPTEHAADEENSSPQAHATIEDKFSAGLFEEDIDDLLAGTSKPIPRKEKKAKQRKQINYGARKSKSANESKRTNEAAHANQVGEATDVQSEWQAEKRVTTARDESFHRNGIGLLIMAIGLAMLPFFAGSVEGLSPVMPYIPLAAIAIAFIACFMIALSMRRSNIGAVLISGLPFLLICLLGLGGYYYTGSLQPAEPVAEVEAAVEEDSKPANDKFTIDRESVEENAASQFVPPLKPKPKPVPDADLNEQPLGQDSAAPKQPVDRIPESDLKPNQITAPRNLASNGRRESSELEQQLERATRQADNEDKLQLLLKREQRDLQKGLVSNDTIRSPRELAEAYKLSDVAGEQTVYGVAYYSTREIKGLDVAHHADNVDEMFDILMPIVGTPQFDDSIALADSSSNFIGLNVVTSSGGISGLQGVFQTVENRQELGKWIGTAPNSDDEFVELRVGSGRVLGIVVYRDQLRAVGIRLVKKNH